MPQPRGYDPTAVPGTKEDIDGGRGGRERDYARAKTAPPALGRLKEGRSWAGCQKMMVCLTAAALLQLQAGMTGLFKRA